MAYIEGSLTSATPAADLCTIIRDELVNEGATSLGSFTEGANTGVVVEVPTDISPLSQKWYLVMYYATSSGTTLNLFPAEGWDGSTDRAIRGTYYNTSNYTPDATTGSRFGSTPQALSTWQAWNLSLSTSALTYALSVSGAAVTGGASTGSAGYAGQMDPSDEVKSANDLEDGYYPLAVVPAWKSVAAATSRVYGGISTSNAWSNRVLSRNLNSSVSRAYGNAAVTTVVTSPVDLGPDSYSTTPKTLPNKMGRLFNLLTLDMNGASSGDRITSAGSVWSVPYNNSGLSNNPVVIRVGDA